MYDLADAVVNKADGVVDKEEAVDLLLDTVGVLAASLNSRCGPAH